MDSKSIIRNMDITNFVFSGRAQAKLYGDWASYRTQLSNKIQKLRKKLGIATRPRAKFDSRAAITSSDIGRDHGFCHLLLLTSERAWAHAMLMRENNSSDKTSITGPTRSHIISRLRKSTLHAKSLYELLKEQDLTGASTSDILEARAYATSLSGALELEKRDWEKCLREYSETRVIYSALGSATKNDIFKDLLSDPVDLSIRYSAYKLQLPRKIAIPTIASRYFPRSDENLVNEIRKLDPGALNDHFLESEHGIAGSDALPKTITWRSQTIDLDDSLIAAAIMSVNEAVKKLSKSLASISSEKVRERALAYDEALTMSQDAVDATKQAIDELLGEGISQSDQRVQSLQITLTALSYDMISWRIGRNRTLVGDWDGAETARTSACLDKNASIKQVREQMTSRRLSRLRENVVLYDAILQSICSMKELPGVAADTALVEELESRYDYFSSLKYLTLASSHSLLMSKKNALALLARAQEYLDKSQTNKSSVMEETELPLKISVTTTESQYLRALLEKEMQRHRALVILENLSEFEQESRLLHDNSPLAGNLHKYPNKSVDLSNLVICPSSLDIAPIKPLFFDAAWNYISYPGKEVKEVMNNNANVVGSLAGDEDKSNQGKRGWFGFGR
ncbi:signal recognition particle 68 kDa protein [Blumeria hordei DH14]|uniref:Signal recognition particle subunit SRP68 n=1 Tax=Blumeria graminis f. sp. hordei (strain DH14) TaxID=546991 RepID=N1J8W9_BLUG1|nr:signal recognition particle 68 kDa protein [Blumeria hordei DH14]